MRTGLFVKTAAIKHVVERAKIAGYRREGTWVRRDTHEADLHASLHDHLHWNLVTGSPAGDVALELIVSFTADACAQAQAQVKESRLNNKIEIPHAACLSTMRWSHLWSRARLLHKRRLPHCCSQSQGESSQRKAASASKEHESRSGGKARPTEAPRHQEVGKKEQAGGETECCRSWSGRQKWAAEATKWQEGGGEAQASGKNG